MNILELLDALVDSSTMSVKKKADAKVLLQHLKAINAFGNAVNAQNGTHEHDWRKVDGRYDYYTQKMTPAYQVCKICNVITREF